MGSETTTSDEGLEELSKEEKVQALDELKVLYPKTNKVYAKKIERPQRVERPFYQGEKEDFERLEKVQYLDERGNPVNLNEEGEP